MPAILVISKHRYFRDEVRSELRKTGYRITTQEDIVEGLKELKWSCPNLIIWDIEPANYMDKRGLEVLRAQYGHIKLLLALNVSEVTDELKLMSDDVFYGSQPIERLSGKVLKLAGELQPLKIREVVSICSFCKRIRSDEDRWLQNNILTEHSLELSYGVCPQCARKHYGESEPALPVKKLVNKGLQAQLSKI